MEMTVDQMRIAIKALDKYSNEMYTIAKSGDDLGSGAVITPVMDSNISYGLARHLETVIYHKS